MLRPTWGVSSQEGASFSPTGLSPSAARFPNTLRLRRPFVTSRGRCGSLLTIPTTPMTQRPQSWHVFGLGYSPFAHHYLGNLCRFLFLRVLRCFTSPGRLPHKEGAWIPPGGLPHSGICGSMVACASPQLFAACYALRRPSVPRHSPYALITLISFSFCFFRLS